MDPSVWGVHFWDVLVCAAVELPPARSRRLFELMREVLPCKHCRSSYRTFLQKFDPANVIVDGDSASALRFVWTIHDYVNQKLGHRSMAFSLLKARTATFTQCASAADVVDALALMALQVETQEECEAYAEAAAVLCELASRLDEQPSCWVHVGPDIRSPQFIWVHALGCRNALHASRGKPSMSRDAFLAQYKNGRAPPSLATVRSAARPASASSARTSSTAGAAATTTPRSSRSRSGVTKRGGGRVR